MTTTNSLPAATSTIHLILVERKRQDSCARTSSAQIPRWFTHLSTAVQKFPKSNKFTLSTAEPDNHIPHGRYMMYREFIFPGSPAVPLIIATTDIRSTKVAELQPGQLNGEAAWYVSETVEQYRINGIVHLLPQPNHELAASFPAARLSKGGQRFEWEEYRRRIFNVEMPAFMRASFCRPAPGSPMGSYDEGKEWVKELPSEDGVQNEEERKLVSEALSNFALVVFEPFSVDFVQMGLTPNQRTMFDRDGNSDRWSERIVVP